MLVSHNNKLILRNGKVLKINETQDIEEFLTKDTAITDVDVRSIDSKTIEFIWKNIFNETVKKIEVTLPEVERPEEEDVTGNYLSLDGGLMSGKGTIQYPRNNSGTLPNHFISAGAGYSVNSGVNGVKIGVCDQSDCLSGLGQDLSDRANGYDLSIVGGANPTTGHCTISFVTHTVDSNIYTTLGYFTEVGNLLVKGNVYTQEGQKQLAIKEETVDLTSDQTITGKKTFTNPIVFSGDAKITATSGVMRIGDASDGNALAVLARSGTNTYFRPGADNAMDLGNSDERWRNLYLSGTAHMTGLNVANNASITADGYVTGTWLQSTATYSISATAASEGIALFHGKWLYYTSINDFKKDLKLVDNNSDQTITGAKAFTGTVGNAQSESGVYLGLDNNPGAPNANIAITSANTASYIDMGKPNHDYDFRIIKWDSNSSNVAQMCYSSEDGGASANITIPRASGTLALTSDLNDYVKRDADGDLTMANKDIYARTVYVDGMQVSPDHKIGFTFNEEVRPCIETNGDMVVAIADNGKGEDHYNFKFPKQSGTVALTSNIPPLDNASGVQSLGWTNADVQSHRVPTANRIAHWNGAYSGTSSNLTYCARGTIASTDDVNKKQDKLISGTNIKTINGESLVGSGNIGIQGTITLDNDWETSGTYTVNLTEGLYIMYITWYVSQYSMYRGHEVGIVCISGKPRTDAGAYTRDYATYIDEKTVHDIQISDKNNGTYFVTARKNRASDTSAKIYYKRLM